MSELHDMEWHELLSLADNQKDEIERLTAELKATQENEQRLVDANKPVLADKYRLQARVEKLEGAIPVCRQFMSEVHHAMSQGPGWYTHGESGLRKQIYMWVDRARAALAATEQEGE